MYSKILESLVEIQKLSPVESKRNVAFFSQYLESDIPDILKEQDSNQSPTQ